MPQEPSGDVKCFSIGGRMIYQRQRCLGMTDEERRWRAQWLKDQVLTPNEPRNVPEYYKDTTNFIRRLWKTPMYKLQCALEPALGKSGAFLMRHAIGKLILSSSIIYFIAYWHKYCVNDFLLFRNIETYITRRPMYPCEPGYPDFPEKTPQDYYDLGFYSSVLCQDAVEIKKDIPVLPSEEKEEKEPTIICPKPEEEE